MDWTALPVAPESPLGDMVVLGAEGSQLAESLAATGCSVEVHADLESLGEVLDGGASVPGVVLVDLGAGSEQPSELALMHETAHKVLHLVQAWLSDERFSYSRLALITRAAVAVRAGEDVQGLAQSPAWGLVRSAQSENPERFLLIDMDGEEASWGVLGGALASGEPQLGLREGVVCAPRLARAGAGGALEAPADVSEWCLNAGGGGTFEDLSLVPAPEAAESLGSEQVRVGVRAGGVNFRDVMVALGLVPQGEATVGGEGAGVVLELGAEVEGLAVGDRVMAPLTGGLGPVAMTDQRLIARMPDGWSFAQAASVPVAFSTAYYGLMDLAGLKAGERVLVHAAAGGVGMAAVQLARYLGAEVFTTASPGKWDTLRSLGLDEAHIASSRTLDFKERFLGETDGRGVDVILDSLAGEFVDASLDLLPEGGRFIEMGKTDIRNPDEVLEGSPGRGLPGV